MPLGDTVLAGDAAASIAEYHATTAGSQKQCYSFALGRRAQWITVNLWNIDQYGPSQRELFERIAYTLRLDQLSGAGLQPGFYVCYGSRVTLPCQCMLFPLSYKV